MFEITVLNNGIEQRIFVNEQTGLLDALRKNNLMAFPCGGHGVCGKCKLKVLSGALPPLYSEEEKLLLEAEKQGNIRLACFVRPASDMTVEILASGEQDIKVLTESIFSGGSDLLNEKIDLQRFDNMGRVFGIAVDIGTTTIAMYLADIKTSEVFTPVSALNPQRSFGSDVVTRMKFAMDNADGAEILHKMLVDKLNDMILSICVDNFVNQEEIRLVSVAANTVITHFLLNLPTKGLAVAPFTSLLSECIKLPANKTGLNVGKEADVLISGCASAYVGGDITCGIGDCEMYDKSEISLLIDIGTNGELVLGSKNKLVCCSCAAGPAFEGSQIKFGMGGAPGAINKFWFEGEKPCYTTINNAKALGICGSGILDITASLLEKGIIDETGLMEVSIKAGGEDIFSITDDIYVTQNDIRQIQLAKAAIRAGIETMLDKMKLSYDDVSTVYLAGGFGNYMDKISAIKIGLLPPQFTDKIINIGNSAGNGAIKALLRNGFFELLEDIREKMEYIELSNMPFFSESYIDNMTFSEDQDN